jgi:hypothetical protein
MLKRPDFKKSEITLLICELFEDAATKDPSIVTWRELQQLTNMSRAKLMGSINTARRRMLNDHRLVFENLRDISYGLVPDPEKANIGQRAIERARVQQRQGLKKMNTADVESLTPQERIRHISRATVLEICLASSKPRTINAVDQMVLRKHNSLSNEEQIEAIREALRNK